jgi:Type III restriction enzyme, res subunit/Helicase conserved C-terminal domain
MKFDIKAARQLIDFQASLKNKERAESQLAGTVALANLLEKQGVAYLADEVGMGKTYVALGVIALFRHFQPDFRVLVISPRENIQDKWRKEFQNFVRNNFRFPDMRVKGIDGGPARPMVKSENLLRFLEEVSIDPNRDFFMRLPSFSIGLSDDPQSWRDVRNKLQRQLPWLSSDLFKLQRGAKAAFKDSLARALCLATPVFDLVIFDEGHNLKHGISERVAARNRVIGHMFGRVQPPDTKLLPGYGPRATRVLFLSATPIDDDYFQLWNQLDVFGKGEQFRDLLSEELHPDKKKEIARQFLIRRVTSLRVNGIDHTKNQYRCEWRFGGVDQHDEPINVDDDRQRLVLALVQKKTAELLGHERFGASFQVGMLASFESFLATAKLKQQVDERVFDDAEQTDDVTERDGVDVFEINRLAKDFRERFSQELPHPKMDAIVERLSTSWETGEKSLVFVRRVQSVTELKRKLDDLYDQWLLKTLHEKLPARLHGDIDRSFRRYMRERRVERLGDDNLPDDTIEVQAEQPEAEEQRDLDTFFSWFFRGRGPRGIVSGARVKSRFLQRGTVYATFFEDNQIMALLGASPGDVADRLAAVLGLPKEKMLADLNRRATKYLPVRGRAQRGYSFDAAQAAALELLKNAKTDFSKEADTVWSELFRNNMTRQHATGRADVGAWLETPTFFSELRNRPELREAIWPEVDDAEPRDRFREQEQRAQMLASAARLGHGLIDLFAVTVKNLKTLFGGDTAEGEEATDERAQINAYLDLLDKPRQTAKDLRQWGVFDELKDIADHFHLILDVNDPEARKTPLSETAKRFGALLRQQQPIGGMSGTINQTLVRQFRMPGYPLVMISTDLLQEGEDLHTFCANVYHYGISWTPSAMEQRIGRVDRVSSITDRHLSSLPRDCCEEEKLQVFYPHLRDTVEVLQVDRVLWRMDDFLRLMHEQLGTPSRDGRRIVLTREMLEHREPPKPITGTLQTAFPVEPKRLKGKTKKLAVKPGEHRATLARLSRLKQVRKLGDTPVRWEKDAPEGALFGTATLGKRQQPFALYLQSMNGHLVMRCVSPVGTVHPGERRKEVRRDQLRQHARLGAILGKEDRSYDLAVEEDVLLGKPEHDQQRVAALLDRVVVSADFLEQKHLPGHDEPLSTFEVDLKKELSFED